MAINAYVAACDCRSFGLNPSTPKNEHAAFDRAEIVARLIQGRLACNAAGGWARTSFTDFKRDDYGNWHTFGQFNFEPVFLPKGGTNNRPSLYFDVMGINSNAQQDFSSLPVVKIVLYQFSGNNPEMVGEIDVATTNILHPERLVINTPQKCTLYLDAFIFG